MKTLSLSADCIFSTLLTAEEKAVLRRLGEMPDSEISYSDIGVLNEDTAKRIVDFEFGLDEQARTHELIARNTNDGLSPEEKLELEQFLNIERILVILKARSMRMIAQMGGACERSEGIVMPHEEVLRWHDEQSKNRPDWQSKYERARNDLAEEPTTHGGNVAEWHNTETVTVEDLIIEAIEGGRSIEGINDPETLNDLKISGGYLNEHAGYTREQLRSLIIRWVMKH